MKLVFETSRHMEKPIKEGWISLSELRQLSSLHKVQLARSPDLESCLLACQRYGKWIQHTRSSCGSLRQWRRLYLGLHVALLARSLSGGRVA